MFIFMVVRVLYPKNLLHFAVGLAVYATYIDFGMRRVAVLDLYWLVHEMKCGNMTSKDAEINAKLVGQARFRIEGHAFWITTHDA